MRLLLLLLLTIAIATGTAASAQTYYDQQRQYQSYQTQHENTVRAYNVPASSYSAPAYKSTSTYSGSSSSSSSSSTGSSRPYSSGTGSNSWGGMSTNIPKAGVESYNDKLRRVWQEKESRRDALLKQRGVTKSPENWSQLISISQEAGFDYFDATRLYGSSAAELKEWMDAASRRASVATGYGGSTKSDCQGDCSETLDYFGGEGSYTGNTRGGKAHGRGTVTLKGGDKFTGNYTDGEIMGIVRIDMANGDHYEGGYDKVAMSGKGRYTYKDGDYDEGTFINNRMLGEGLVSRGSYINTGTWGANGATGIHTYKYKNGRIVTGDMDKDPVVWKEIAKGAGGAASEPGKDGITTKTTYDDGTTYEGEVYNGKSYSGKYTYKNGAGYEGLLDKDSHYIKGKMTYPNGAVFIGEFKAGKMYRGTYSYQYGVFTGEFEEAGVNFKVGRHVDKDLSIHDQFYGPMNKMEGYKRTRTPDGKVQEAIFHNDQRTGPIIYDRGDPGVFTGLAGQEGYQLYGTLKPKASPATIAALTATGEWITPPETERAKALAAAKTARDAIEKGRAEYRAAMKWNPAITL